MPKPDCRLIADVMAGDGASYVLLASREQWGDVIASCVAAFRDACIEYGIIVEPGDLAYYSLRYRCLYLPFRVIVQERLTAEYDVRSDFLHRPNQRAE
jgi:hypothetical protein